MTVDTKLSFDKAYIDQFSKDRNEPDWMRDFRLDTIERAETLEIGGLDGYDAGRGRTLDFGCGHSGEGNVQTLFKVDVV